MTIDDNELQVSPESLDTLLQWCTKNGYCFHPSVEVKRLDGIGVFVKEGTAYNEQVSADVQHINIGETGVGISNAS